MSLNIFDVLKKVTKSEKTYCCNATTYQLGSLLASQRSGVVTLIPLPVWKAVNKDDAVLHQGLGSDQLVVGGIVDHIDDPGLSCAACIRARAISPQKINYTSTMLARRTVDLSGKCSFLKSISLPPHVNVRFNVQGKFNQAYTRIPMRSCQHQASEHGTSCSHHGPSLCGCDELRSSGEKNNVRILHFAITTYCSHTHLRK